MVWKPKGAAALCAGNRNAEPDITSAIAALEVALFGGNPGGEADTLPATGEIGEDSCASGVLLVGFFRAMTNHLSGLLSLRLTTIAPCRKRWPRPGRQVLVV
jgi:hypothetical protein